MQFRNIAGLSLLAGALAGCYDHEPASVSLAESSYSGSRDKAALTATNGSRFPQAAFLVRELSLAGSSVHASICSNNGKVTTHSSIDSASRTGSKTQTFNSCLVNGNLLDGVIETVVSDYDGEHAQPLSVQVTFNGLEIRQGSAGQVTLTGSLAAEQDLLAKTVALTMEIHLEAADGKQILARLDSGVTGHVPSRSASSTLEGSVCLDTEGCVDMRTVTPFGVDCNGGMTEGELIITGAHNSTVQMRARSHHQIALNVDADGDGAYD